MIWSAAALEARDQVLIKVQNAISRRATEIAKDAGRDRISQEDVEIAWRDLTTDLIADLY